MAMSELLKDVMNERASAAAGPNLDLEAIMANGDKRIRRRRVAVGAAATAAVVAAVLAVPAVVDHDSLGRRDTPPATTKGAFVPRATTYAVDTTIYYGDDAIDVSPHSVTSMVQTDFGFIFTAKQGDHQGVFWTNASDLKQIGQTDQQAGTLLAADDSGPYAEWVDTDAEPVPEFVVFDTATGRQVVRTSEGNKPVPDQADEFDLPVVHAIDDDTAYWHSSAGTVAYDLTAGTQQVIQPHSDATYLYDVADGTFAHSSQNLSTAVGHDIGAARPFVPGIGEPVLSPSATFVMTMPGTTSKIWTVDGQKDVTPDAGPYRTVLLTQWLDDFSFAAIGSRSGNIYRGDVAMLVCSVTDGQCTTDSESIGSLDRLIFPLGGSLTDR
jgi:hypothetical protein